MDVLIILFFDREWVSDRKANGFAGLGKVNVVVPLVAGTINVDVDYGVASNYGTSGK